MKTTMELLEAILAANPNFLMNISTLDCSENNLIKSKKIPWNSSEEYCKLINPTLQENMFSEFPKSNLLNKNTNPEQNQGYVNPFTNTIIAHNSIKDAFGKYSKHINLKSEELESNFNTQFSNADLNFKTQKFNKHFDDLINNFND